MNSVKKINIQNRNLRDLSLSRVLTRNSNSLDKVISRTKQLDFSYSKLHSKKLIVNHSSANLMNENSYSTLNHSNINSSQIKERLIQNLKNNFSQDRIRRKKMLNVNVNVNLNQNYSLLNAAAQNQQSFCNDSMINNNNLKNFYKKDQPLKLYTDASAVNIRKNEESSANINEKIFDLELKMEKMFKDNKTNSKSRKYNIIKFIFGEGIKLFTNVILQNFLKKLMLNYHNVVSAYCNENKLLKEKTESLQNKILDIDRNFVQTQKQLREKESEIEKLKQKLNNINSSLNSSNNNILMFDPKQVTFSAMDDDLINSNALNKHQTFILKLNKENIEDLDALYFNDKVDMEADSKKFNIPRLNLDTVNSPFKGISLNLGLQNKGNNLKIVNKK